MSKIIAVFDDSAPFRYMIRQILQSASFEVDLFDSPAAIFNQPAKLAIYDLLVMDIHMPGMDGITALEHIRSYPETVNTPVIIVTGSAIKEMVVLAARLRVATFVSKPIDPTDFLSRIVTMIGLPGGQLPSSGQQ